MICLTSLYLFPIETENSLPINVVLICSIFGQIYAYRFYTCSIFGRRKALPTDFVFVPYLDRERYVYLFYICFEFKPTHFVSVPWLDV